MKSICSRSVGLAVLLGAAFLMAGCGSGSNSGNINGNWTATLTDPSGGAEFAFTTSLTQGSGTSVNVVNFNFTTSGILLREHHYGDRLVYFGGRFQRQRDRSIGTDHFDGFSLSEQCVDSARGGEWEQDYWHLESDGSDWLLGQRDVQHVEVIAERCFCGELARQFARAGASAGEAYALALSVRGKGFARSAAESSSNCSCPLSAVTFPR